MCSARSSIAAFIAAGFMFAAAGPAPAAEARASAPPAADVRALLNKPAKKLFGHQKTPARLPPQPIGFYSRGCAAGNVAIELTGPAWQVMRPHRNRYWGQPRLIAFLRKFAHDAKRKVGWRGLLIGDLSQPRGGPMLTGHASHQIGLDADIWLTEMPDRILTIKERNTISATLMTLDRKRINLKRFTMRHARLLKLAASYPEVQRIFVHPPIKKFLCDISRGNPNRRWLAKIRPLYGHNYHFHVRLRCPKGAKYCKDQGDPKPADGTGCGKHLAYWYSCKPWRSCRIVRKGPPAPPPKLFHEGIPLPRPRPRRLVPPPPKTLAWLPQQCRMVLVAP